MKYLTMSYNITQHHAIWWNYPLSHWSKCKLMNKCGDCSGVKGQGEVLVRRWWLVNRAIGLEAIPPGAGGRGGQFDRISGTEGGGGEGGNGVNASWIQVNQELGQVMRIIFSLVGEFCHEKLWGSRRRKPTLVTHPIRLHFHVSAQKNVSCKPSSLQ